MIWEKDDIEKTHTFLPTIFGVKKAGPISNSQNAATRNELDRHH